MLGLSEQQVASHDVPNLPTAANCFCITRPRLEHEGCNPITMTHSLWTTCQKVKSLGWTTDLAEEESWASGSCLPPSWADAAAPQITCHDSIMQEAFSTKLLNTCHNMHLWCLRWTCLGRRTADSVQQQVTMMRMLSWSGKLMQSLLRHVACKWHD